MRISDWSSDVCSSDLFDEDLRDGLTEEMQKKGVDLRINADIASIERKGKLLIATLKDGSTIEAGFIMYATGRVPNSHGMGPEEAGEIGRASCRERVCQDV